MSRAFIPSQILRTTKLLLLFSLAKSFSASGLTIVPTFDASITGDPNGATIMATINSVIALYQTNLSDPVTVTITFQETGGGLGASSTFFVSQRYSTVLSHLTSDATTPDDTNALAHLPGGQLIRSPATGTWISRPPTLARSESVRILPWAKPTGPFFCTRRS